tara:strand:+ start:7110 stop:7358 length:249 start_codon:yes stop_codon:yes gene_type:complete
MTNNRGSTAKERILNSLAPSKSRCIRCITALVIPVEYTLSSTPKRAKRLILFPVSKNSMGKFHRVKGTEIKVAAFTPFSQVN